MICKSPLRVSFFGGGTDYPDYYGKFPGGVLGTSIDKYIYIASLPMAGYADTKFRVTYRNVEAVDRIEDIKHNAVRAVLLDRGFDSPLNIAIISDLPGNSGLGSSSSFTVGFVRLISDLQQKKITKFDLMKEAVRIEREVLGENVGIQDQTHAAFGGLSHYTFHKDEFGIRPIQMKTECRDALSRSLCLVYTGVQRSASDTLVEQIKRTNERKIDTELKQLVDLCLEGSRILEASDPDIMLKEFGALLSQGWETKRKLSSLISSQRIDEIYETGMRFGAFGGKLCGAGGGGFMLFLASEKRQEKLAETFGEQSFVKIQTEDSGAQIILR